MNAEFEAVLLFALAVGLAYLAARAAAAAARAAGLPATAVSGAASLLAHTIA
jgi:hypothetical protein